ncbi:Arm DNA-binding domain-containing protein [Niabella sp. W65]|nr:Arm DNA-binding domain-containing protein [Niabella sp. W65]MCH7362714.1 Arm DNA-binding domain-containing protein [Niabella sp. W65]ULT38669.1 Arm DNA-binding domain-containing protein [Niabella sp. I65]
MKVNERLSILFYPSRKRASATSDLAPIYTRITIDEQRKDFPSGQKCRPNDWDSKKQIVTGRTPDVRAINNAITDIKATLVKLYDQLVLKGELVTSERLKMLFKNYPSLIDVQPRPVNQPSLKTPELQDRKTLL